MEVQAEADNVVTAAKVSSADDGAVSVADDVFAWLLMGDDGSGGELLNLLEDVKDTVVEPASTVGGVRFIDDPYSSLLVFQSSSSYITINGNEESCGSSFSDSGTSVMASVDTNGLRGKLVGSVEELGRERSASASRNDTTREEGSVIEWDDEVLARFLGEEEGGEEVGFSEKR
ncbi:uncharacterized protein LOC129319200 [Prosopis cineraria]|uniref:uncharacterized protein LOC129319200 n=1 Tax=Prosopis cineraria TaxID=364024 RepID=UPI00240FECD2|nr:uncharacterized protein LOC129319200 [Prosopis cineraria]